MLRNKIMTYLLLCSIINPFYNKCTALTSTYLQVLTYKYYLQVLTRAIRWL